MKNKNNLQLPCDKIYVYSCDNKIDDLRRFHEKNKKNIILLNPFSVLNILDKKKINLYDTLPYAEVGNAFGGIDV